jgi:GAF domain-containing protein
LSAPPSACSNADRSRAATPLDHLQGIIQPDVAAVTLLKGESGLSIIAARGDAGWAGREDIPDLPIDELTDAVLQRMKLERKSLIVPNVKDYPIGDERGRLNHIQNWLLVPIIASGKIIGIVGLGKTRMGVFDREQSEWAEALVRPGGGGDPERLAVRAGALEQRAAAVPGPQTGGDSGK